MKFYQNQPILPNQIAPDIQDRNGEAWQQLIALIDQAAEDKRELFSPRKDLGYELWSQITVLPKTIAKLKHVKRLMLYGSNLTRIPPEIGEMTALEEFTPYTSYGLKWFPYEIAKCKNLKNSTVSTRAIYGNFKFRTVFPNLNEQKVRYHGNDTKCSVCGNSEPTNGFNQVWISLWVATDVLPLLANLCSEACYHALPAGAENHLSYPHKGGLDLHQPPNRF